MVSSTSMARRPLYQQRRWGNSALTCAVGRSGRRESNPHRELGKLPRPAPDGVIVQLGGHGHEPWLSVDDRCRPMLRHGGGTASEDGVARSLLSMVTSSTRG